MMKKTPAIKIETLEQEKLHTGFLGIDRRKVKISYPQGPLKPDDQLMTIDSVIRKANDAVAIVAHFELNKVRNIYLRSCLRPAVSFRNYMEDSEREEIIDNSAFWEIPAGLVDDHERGWGGLLLAAERELYEETGLNVSVSDIHELGARYFSSAGMCAERIFFYEVEVNPFSREIPKEDNSPLELCGEVITMNLYDALEAVENGQIVDAKTQMGILRLASKFGM